MNQKPPPAAEPGRTEAPRETPHEQGPTYQELLDESLEETFPASDPIAPGAASHPTRPVRTGKDERDWELDPGGDRPSPTPSGTSSGEGHDESPSAPPPAGTGRPGRG